ncbi:DUF3110 domain-containing protein [Gloeocapsa sp. PCC 73106]|uniref:DUF3110 domain-containing protein n=1 Tax=Gloeocapsa sp. PCC 73106 TaxID=102232 RepID=UPI0002ABE657|nr:DUF3110 domain-containing protein [Gloeocapsa sp. PCC 73106]ELR97330.1 Protein of unknown function (DUF3110) [Gloeocapsa sp. PCC 73106]
MRVYILLFNARTENEGIHTLQMGNRNKVLMFESEDDATRYGMMLEAQNFPTATVEEMDSEEIIAFCLDADYDYEIIENNPKNLVIPPENNVDETDWQKELDNSDEKELSAAEMERIRRQLEGLI